MRRLRGDPGPDELGVSLEAAGRQDHRHAVGKLGKWLSEPYLRPPRQNLRKASRIEAPANRQRVPRLARHDGSTEPFHPGERVVEAFPDDSLEPWIPARTLGPKALEVPVAPDDAAREVHRPAWPRALLKDKHVCAELARTHRGGQAGHPSPRDDEVGQRARRGRTSACARRTRA